MYILNISLQLVSIFGVFKMVMVQNSRAQISEDVLYCMHFTNDFICMKTINFTLYTAIRQILGATLWCENFLILRNPPPPIFYIQQQHHGKKFAQSKLQFNYYLCSTKEPHTITSLLL